jgi:hypothetical protein
MRSRRCSSVRPAQHARPPATAASAQLRQLQRRRCGLCWQAGGRRQPVQQPNQLLRHLRSRQHVTAAQQLRFVGDEDQCEAHVAG